MIVLSAEEAGRALEIGLLKTAVSGVSTDTRSLRPGDLFVALRGERFDGHDYVEAALAAGACGAVVERRSWGARRTASGEPGGGDTERNIYPVDDTLEALGVLAREVRRKSGALVLAVTGSAGKTSTKDILAAMVSRVCRVAATAANQNNEVGVPLTLLQIEPDTQAVVVEMGMRGRGQIAALARVAEPDVGIVTNVYPVHLELLGTLQDIAEAKAELIQGLRLGGVGVAPLVCEPLEPCLSAVGRRVVRFRGGGRPPLRERVRRRGRLCRTRGERSGPDAARPVAGGRPRAWRSPRSRAIPLRICSRRRPRATPPDCRWSCVFRASLTPVPAKAAAK